MGWLLDWETWRVGVIDTRFCTGMPPGASLIKIKVVCAHVIGASGHIIGKSLHPDLRRSENGSGS